MKIIIRLPGGGHIRIEREPLDSDSKFYLLMALVALAGVGTMFGVCIMSL